MHRKQMDWILKALKRSPVDINATTLAHHLPATLATSREQIERSSVPDGMCELGLQILSSAFILRQVLSAFTVDVV